ncbi:MAG TPA: cytochrome b N-terminal domain-containing protein [Candidatus Dormibacteraeota bacterium]|nr:cytochrome b N-terminal domain-containing protein [Candidatus Dormibacteraeota bacterium]
MLQWLEERTGIVSLVEGLLTEDVPGGASYWYVFGSATVVALIIQIVTGIFLTFYYAPSSATAWESTKFIYDKVNFGQFIIGIHYWGASAMIALMFLHLLQVVLWGAYKRPREVMWVIGVVLLVCTLVMGLTGYLLPWDLNAYFASQVSMNIAGSAPVLGGWVQRFLQDGPAMGTLTINRFFGIHVWLVPIILLLLVGMHLTVFRHNGAAGPVSDEPPKGKPGRFWPNQMFMDTLVSLVVFAVIVFLAITSPPELLLKADPNNSTFVPSPAWYFLPLYGILNLTPPSLEVVATIILPTLFIVALMLLPWIDRNRSRALARRPFLVGITAVVVVILIGTGVYGQDVIGQRAALSGGNVGICADACKGEQVAATPASTLLAGKPTYLQKCAACHQATGAGLPGSFPPLAGNPTVTGDPKQLIDIVLNGKTGPITVLGKSYNGAMPAWKGQLTNAEIASVITYIRNDWGNKASAVTQSEVAAQAK